MSAADLERFFEISPNLLIVVDRRGHLLRMNGSWFEALGWDAAAMIGHHFSEYLHPDDLIQTKENLSARSPQHGSGPAIVNRYRHADGSYRWLRWQTRFDGDEKAVWCVAQDVTEQHVRAQQQQVVADLGRLALGAHSHGELLQAAVDGLVRGLSLPAAAVLELLPDGQLQARASSGTPRLDLTTVISTAPSTLMGPALALGGAVWVEDVQTDPACHPIHRQLGMHGVVVAPVGDAKRPWGLLTAGDVRPCRFDDAQLRFVEQVAHVVGVANERAAAEVLLQHQATHDTLTGLPNRELLRERMHASLREGRRAGKPVGLLLCDLNGFKDVNDSLGHAAGDAVLQQLAQRLLATVGHGDTVARLGGDEFAICVVGAPTELEVLGMADAVIRAMRAPFSLPEFEVPLSTSIGVVVSPTHGRDASTLLRHADIAMYRAKTERLGWALYDASVDGERSDRLVLTADLRKAIATEELVLHYQPVVELATGRLHSVEALCRWEHGDRGTVAPTMFIPLAEQTGAILPLTAWVVRQAASQVRSWRKAGHDIRCAVNLSMAAMLDDQACSPLIDELIAAAPLLTVEITESWLVDARGQEVIAELADGGVQLALDDFGTGYSSLAALRSFPVHQLKLDQQFVRDLDSDDRADDVLHAIAALAAALGMDVVAEGVEEARTAQRLRDAGIRLGQGLLWSPALAPEELDCWLTR